MSIFRPDSENIVRQKSPWVLPRGVYAAVFVAVALGAFGWKAIRARPEPPPPPAQATATVCIDDSKLNVDKAWQQILGQAKAEIRTKLSMKTVQAGPQMELAVSLADLPPETVVPLVNAVGMAFVQACRGEWMGQVEHAYSAAQEKVHQAERQVYEAQLRLDELHDRRRRALAAAQQPPTPVAIMVDNPRWVELNHRLSQLEDRKRNLLFDRMPLHPSVQDVDMRIAEARREVASLPPKIAQEGAPPPQPHVALLPADAPDPAELQRLQQTADQAKNTLAQAQQSERSALAARNQEPKIELRAAEPIASPPPTRSTLTAFWVALATAMTSVAGVAMVSLGARLEPTLDSVAMLQSLLPVPVVGVVPATHPARTSPSDVQRRLLARWGWMAAGLVALVVVLCLFVRT